MDLRPFLAINPCGYPGLNMIQLADLQANVTVHEVSQQLLSNLIQQLGYSEVKTLHTSWQAS